MNPHQLYEPSPLQVLPAARLATHRRKYDEEFIRETLRLWRTSGRSAESIAQERGLNVFTLYRWSKDRRPGSEETPPPPQNVAALKAENARLRDEAKELREQLLILRKALSIAYETLNDPFDRLPLASSGK